MTMRYDKFVVHGNRIIVLGYDTGESMIEVRLFRLGSDGVLRREGTFQIRVNCKYSIMRARLAGDKLVLFAGSPLNTRDKQLLSSLPALRAWNPGSIAAQYRPLVTAHRVYRFPVDSLIGSLPYLSSITTCDVATSDFDCEARVIVGPRDGDYHISRNALYIGCMREEIIPTSCDPAKRHLLSFACLSRTRARELCGSRAAPSTSWN